jgi:hypothetical protein
MNALVGQEAKANFSLFWLICDEGADDGAARMAVISPARALADISEGDASSRFFMTAPRNCNRQG